jgi:hypothetical protein
MSVEWNFDPKKANRAVADGVQAKLAGLRCPVHGDTPVVSFEKQLQIRGCCNRLIAAAHARLGKAALP